MQKKGNTLFFIQLYILACVSLLKRYNLIKITRKRLVMVSKSASGVQWASKEGSLQTGGADF